MNFQLIIAVAFGGALGSVTRYLVGIGSGRLLGVDFPWGTLIINVTGSFLIGMFATRWDLPQAVRVFLTVGICGGYTTFSTFSLDAFYLMERGQAVAVGPYDWIGGLVGRGADRSHVAGPDPGGGLADLPIAFSRARGLVYRLIPLYLVLGIWHAKV